MQEFKILVSPLLIALSFTGCSLAESMKKMENNTTDMNQTTRAMDDNLVKVGGTMDGMKGDMGELKADMKAMKADVSERLAGTMEKMLVFMDQLNTRMESMNKTLDEKLAGKMDAMANALINDMVPVMKDMKDQMVTLQTLMKGLSTSIDEKMLGKMDGLQRSITSLNAIIEKQMVKIMSEMNTTMREGLLQTMKGMKDQITAMNTELTQMRGSIAGMSKKMNALPAMNRTLKDVSKTMKDTLPAVKTSIDRMDTKMGTMLDELKAMRHQFQSLVDLIPPLREALSYFVRDRGYANLTKPSKMIEKFADAGVFIFGFEFQLKQPEDTAEYRALLHVFIQEFTRKVRGLIHNENKMDVDPMLADNDHKALQAIAACLQEISPDQIRMVDECKAKKKVDTTARCLENPRTVYDVLKVAIKHFNDDPDKQFFFQDDPSTPGIHKPHKEAQLQKQAIMYLMQLRYNFLAALAAGQLFHAEEAKSMVWSDTLGEWWSIRGVWWDSLDELNEERLAHLNEEGFNFIITALEYAIETRSVIRDAGQTAIVDWKLSEMFNNIHFAKLETFDQNTVDKKRRIERLKKTISLVNVMRANYAKDRTSQGGKIVDPHSRSFINFLQNHHRK